ncbi:MAG: 4a-hydroxytetrahydrobiopterin dehydratase [Bacteroidetes bacterium]|jgi:4a-hydroxytetrahydrobiopterin dehydratase|nr:4a-hydroxytetrahydrobiopterin dehydratase [Bacteroidota bacterium]
MMELKENNCVPLSEGTDAMKKEEIERYKKQLLTEWLVTKAEKLKKTFLFENYKRAMAFVQEVALIAEKENHHPDICIYHTTVEIELTTHDVGGLSINDFIIAAKIEDL